MLKMRGMSEKIISLLHRQVGGSGTQRFTCFIGCTRYKRMNRLRAANLRLLSQCTFWTSASLSPRSPSCSYLAWRVFQMWLQAFFCHGLVHNSDAASFGVQSALATGRPVGQPVRKELGSRKLQGPGSPSRHRYIGTAMTQHRGALCLAFQLVFMKVGYPWGKLQSFNCRINLNIALCKRAINCSQLSFLFTIGQSNTQVRPGAQGGSQHGLKVSVVIKMVLKVKKVPM